MIVLNCILWKKLRHNTKVSYTSLRHLISVLAPPEISPRHVGFSLTFHLFSLKLSYFCAVLAFCWSVIRLLWNIPGVNRCISNILHKSINTPSFFPPFFHSFFEPKESGISQLQDLFYISKLRIHVLFIQLYNRGISFT